MSLSDGGSVTYQISSRSWKTSKAAFCNHPIHCVQVWQLRCICYTLRMSCRDVGTPSNVLISAVSPCGAWDLTSQSVWSRVHHWFSFRTCLKLSSLFWRSRHPHPTWLGFAAMREALVAAFWATLRSVVSWCHAVKLERKLSDFELSGRYKIF